MTNTERTPYALRTPDSIKASIDSISPDAIAELRAALQTWFDNHQPEAERDFAGCETPSGFLAYAYDWFAYGN